MVELIVVLLLAGIVSFSAMGRLNDVGEVNAQGFADQLASSIRFAQKAAIAQRRIVYVNVTAASSRIYACLDAATGCAQPLFQPAGGSLDLTGPASVAITTTNSQFSFNGAGIPSTATVVTIVASAATGQSFTVTVQPDSGYVQRN
jgi:MSHA pilin protein MshC